MKNFSKVRRKVQGYLVYRLIDDEGDPVVAFDDYAEHLIERQFAQSTITRYLVTVAGFLDYLTEAGVFGQAATSREINKVVNSYLAIKKNADRIRSMSDCGDEDETYRWARSIVESLDMQVLNKPGNAAAAINRFLRRSELIALEEWQMAEVVGLKKPSGSYKALIEVVTGFDPMPEKQRITLKQKSFLAAAHNMCPKGIAVPRGLRSDAGAWKDEHDYFDLPTEYFEDLIDAANTARDRALWLLLGGTGIRMSEAMNLQWSDIDIVNQQVFVNDPDFLRFGGDLSRAEKRRFKGRIVSRTAFIPQIQLPFFKALEEYVKTESIVGVDHDFVFQSLHSVALGEPMLLQSDAARTRNFNRAVKRANIPLKHNGRNWTAHALRHMYGVYMLNALPVPDGYGLTLDEVRRCMGHVSTDTTKHYARENKEILNAKLAFADAQVLKNQEGLDSLPRAIAKRLQHAAEQIIGRIEGNTK